MQNGSRHQMCRLINELLDELVQVGADRDYYKCILDGTWPSSVDTLTKSLQRAEQLRAENPERYE
jgi:hypothetical protein